MEISKSKRMTAYIGCFLMAMVVQVSTQALNNIGYPILEAMGRADLFILAATLSGLGMAVVCPIGGKLGDLYGRSRVALIGGVACFVLHLVLAFISSPVVWVVVRSAIPFTIGLFLSIPFSLPAELYPESYSQKVGIISCGLAAGIVVGSYGGSLLYTAGLDKLAIVAPGILALVGAILISSSVPNRASKGVKLDVAGVVWLTVFLSVFCIVLTFAGTWGFFSAASIAGYLIAIVSAVLLYKTEQKVADPCLPFKLFKNKVFLFLALFSCFTGAYQYVIQVYTPLFGQNVLGLSVATTGSFQLPRTIVCIIAPIVCGIVLKKTPHAFKNALVWSAIIVIASFIPLLIPGLSHNIVVIYAALALTGIGEGLKNVSTNPLAMTTLEPQNIGVGIGLMSSMGSIGCQVTNTLVGVVFNANVSKGMDAACFSTYYLTIGFTLLSLLAVLAVRVPKAQPAAQS